MARTSDRFYAGCARAAWGFLLLHVDFSLGPVNVLPAFAGYLLLYGAITRLEETRRELGLLKGLCALLAAWEGAVWLLGCLGLDWNSLVYPLGLPLQAASLYFHFQFLTDLAALAAEHQGEGQGLDRRLLRLRTALVSITTALYLLLDLGLTELPWWGWTSFGLLLLDLGVVLLLMSALFQLRRTVPPPQPSSQNAG